MFDWLRLQELEDEYWARYDYINEPNVDDGVLKAEHHDPVAEYEHLIDPDMSEEEINQVIDDYHNRKERPQLRAQCDFDEDIPF